MTAEKLKSALRELRFGLLLRVIVFLLLMRFMSDGGIAPAVLFVFGAVFLYARPTFNALPFLASFAGMVILAMLMPFAFQGTAYDIAVLALAGLFYILLRLKELLFIRRLWWHEALHAGVLYLATLGYFLTEPRDSFFLKHLLLGALFFFLANELFAAHGRIGASARHRASAAVFALLFLEVVWALALLPIGYASATGIAALFAFLLLHLGVFAASDILRPQTVLRYTAIVLALVFLIALVSRWSL
ncbi:MAG: hypothetical protein HYT82_02630 [Candidatus Harrisonbacteria bacterium]|nr:hypothetical protein [Candidatus Harrisonbacteria bacterium]